MTRPSFTRLIGACLLILLSGAGAAFTPEPSEAELEAKAHHNDPIPTTVVVRVVAHRSMVLGHEVGGARVTITDVATRATAGVRPCNRENRATKARSCARRISWKNRSTADGPRPHSPPPSNSHARRWWRLPRKGHWPIPARCNVPAHGSADSRSRPDSTTGLCCSSTDIWCKSNIPNRASP